MSKFSKAPGKTAASAPPSPDDFIDAANNVPGSEAYPWIGEDDIKRRSGFNMRFTDAELKKLKYITENVPATSMHEFCIRILTPAINSKVEEILRDKRKRA